jgi:RND family efflux transporter MFP subunit
MKKTALFAALLMLLTATSCTANDAEQEIVVPIYETDEINYKTEEATVGDITQKYYIDGSFNYPYYENVYFKISGKIESVNVEENDTVSEGDLLCVLDSSDLDRQLEEKQLYVDQAQKSVDTLKKEGSSSSELELAQTELELAQLEYQHLEDSLDDYNVYAPCDGVFKADKSSAFGEDITSQHGAQNLIIAGAEVNAGQQLGMISDHSQEYLVCYVYDNALENVNFGTRVQLTQGMTEAYGKVVDIIDGDNDGMNAYTYVIQPEEDSGLSDLTVQCCFEVYSKLDTVIVPEKAVKTSGDRTYVNVLINGTKVEQDVETGIEDGDNIEILSGLSGGEQVIVN